MMDLSRLIHIISNSENNYPQSFSRKGNIYTCINPFSYHIVRKHINLYLQMDGIYVDGIFMCLLIKAIWHNKISRLSFDMTGIAECLFNRLNSNAESIYFIGAQQSQIEATIKNIHSEYPNINISGYRNGYFNTHEERWDVINKIKVLNPDFVVVGMGAPIQEQFALDLKNNGYKGIVFTCGGFLHQTSNHIKYYPDWVNRYNLRAFYRLFKEKGLLKRLYNVLIQFPILFIWDTLKTKRLFIEKNKKTVSIQNE